jgi:hypothetical protein
MSDNEGEEEVEQKALDKPEPVSKDEEDKDKSAESFGKAVKEADGELIMHVKVASPFRDYYDGKAFSISAEDGTGPFDILPKHHNFISLLNPCEIVVRQAGGKEEPIRLRVDGGLMHVKADEVLVFLDV